MTESFTMTERGYGHLRDELAQLKKTERVIVAQAIAEARQHGDLSENAEYHAAKERQRVMEDRIAYLEKRLTFAKIVEVKDPGDGRIVFGASVVVVDGNGHKKSFRIVGEDEADLKQKLISSSSPFARELLGKKAGEVLEIKAPGGPQEYEVLQVSYQ